jgi:ribosomal protein L11 methyltransferase
LADFFRLKVLGLSRDDEYDFTQSAFEIGASGVAEDLKFVQADLRYDPDVVETPEFDLNVYFETKPNEDALLKLQKEYPKTRLELLAEENRDWLEEWKKGFKPFLFSKPFWVIPSWLTAPPEAPKDPRYLLFVEPGMAFGTGTHETTRLAAGFIIEELGRKTPQSLLDVGTGTGVLALVANRLGVEKVVGIDNDPEARRTARENLELNKNTVIEIPDKNVEDISETFDIVVANIIDGVLTLLRHELNRVLKPGGRMILSGVLTDREREFYENFTKETGLKLLETRVDGEWSGAILEKGARET